MEYLFIYGLQLAKSLTALGVVIFFVPIVTALFIVMGIQDCDFFTEQWNKWLKTLSINCIIISLLLFMLPNKQTLLLMGGIYYGKKAINTVTSSEKLEKVNKIIDLQLDKYIKELNND